MMRNKKARHCLLVCKNFEKEIVAAVKLEGLTDIDVIPFPVFCQLAFGKRCWPDDFLAKLSREYERIEVIGGGCLRAITRAKEETTMKNIVFHEQGQCFYPLIGKTLTDHYLQQGAYLLSSGWLDHWQTHLQQLGFDGSGIREFFAESCTKLVLIDTAVSVKSGEKLRQMAEWIDRPFEIIPIGLDFIRLFVSRIVTARFSEESLTYRREERGKLEQQAADYAMALDVVGTWTQLSEEAVVVENIMRLFHQLFGAATIRFLLLNDADTLIYTLNSDETIVTKIVPHLLEIPAEYEWINGDDGFRMRIGEKENTIGSIELGQFDFPQYRQYYFNLALNLGKVCSMAIAIARAYKKNRDLNEALQNSVFQLEEQSQELFLANQNLAVVNGDLESFSYSVSHDLCAPLRNMDVFTQILLERYAPKLDEKGAYYLLRVQACSQKMGVLIRDMLTLSRVGRTALNLREVNLSEIVEALLRELQESEPERSISLCVQEGLFVKGDPALLRIMLQNLLGNAWKFSAKNPNAMIAFGQTEINGKLAFFIRDNGAGFDMTLADKLFAPFQRLHAAADYPGTGIGLATALRVIRRHGGEIWAVAALEEGATFYFHLGAN
ncbi:ATP-binding protein [Azotosporobacter soli]|uniref:ATP-binding protein n=1 Tax=Azotosporobacter soli TaxID=3055040 RepID=UPI0031FF1C2F